MDQVVEYAFVAFVVSAFSLAGFLAYVFLKACLRRLLAWASR